MDIKDVTYNQLLDWLDNKSPFTINDIKNELKHRYVTDLQKNKQLIHAAHEVISWTEISYRPPVADEIETGRMANVRLHALAELYKALH